VLPSNRHLRFRLAAALLFTTGSSVQLLLTMPFCQERTHLLFGKILECCRAYHRRSFSLLPLRLSQTASPRLTMTPPPSQCRLHLPPRGSPLLAASAKLKSSSVTEFTSTATWTASRPLSTTTITQSITIISTTTSCSLSSRTSSSSPSPPSNGLPSSQDGSCGIASGQTCLGSAFGDCCSRLYTLFAYELNESDTRQNTAIVDEPIATARSAKAASPALVSAAPHQRLGAPPGPPQPTNSRLTAHAAGQMGIHARLGLAVHVSQLSSPLSDLISLKLTITLEEYGYCGTTSSYCTTGCQPLFGTCSPPTSPQPSPTLKVSPDGSCGVASGQTCLGSTFGDCCSQYSFCGGTAVYCSEGCQPQYGNCDQVNPNKGAYAHSERDRSRREGKEGIVRREIGGKGPDYTYPPIPHTTVTTSVTNHVIVFPSGVVGTTTVLGGTRTTVGGILTLTRTTSVATSIATVCSKR
jgi:hypothetical protein